MIRTKLKLSLSGKFLHSLVLVCYLAFATISCSGEYADIDSPDSGAKSTICFRIRLPASATPRTYALNHKAETEIATIDILLFSHDDQQQDALFASGPFSGVITETDNETVEISAEIPALPDSEQLTVAIFANSRDALNAAFADDENEITTSTTKEQIYERLTVAADIWNADDAQSYTPIPMWGEAPAEITDNSITIAETVSLIRMLARINVSVVEEVDNFILTTVHLYNYNTVGRIAPKTVNLNETNDGVTAPSIPQNLTKAALPATYSADEQHCTNTIYTFEAEAGQSIPQNEKPCLVIGGIFGNDDEAEETFYRIDFIGRTEGSETIAQLDLLRNHSYNVVIERVSAEGKSSPEAALSSEPMNMTASVAEWNNSAISNVSYGTIMIGVSKAEFFFNALSHDATDTNNRLTVETNNADGWTASVLDENKMQTSSDFWLSITPQQGGMADNNTITLLLTDNTAADAVARTAFVCVKAGQASYMVRVEQGAFGSLGDVQPLSNCYIAKPKSQILIPVQRANESELGVQLDENTPFDAMLVWTDNANGVAPTSNINTVRAVGAGSGGYVFVETGEAEGNAVVAIMAGEGILWSWHVWVTNYEPIIGGSSGKFMDRNLGAIGNTPGTPTSNGLLYQWGRKDPFPGAKIATSNSMMDIYDHAGGEPKTDQIFKIESTTAQSNFVNSVRNPATFYKANAISNDWYTTASGQRNNKLWDDGVAKTIYDPCPDEWTIPKSIDTSKWVSPWLSTNKHTFPKGTGVIWSYGGYYPAAGHRECDSGLLSSVGTYGCYWGGSTFSTSTIYSELFRETGKEVSVTHNRASAFSVRCIKA